VNALEGEVGFIERLKGHATIWVVLPEALLGDSGLAQPASMLKGLSLFPDEVKPIFI